MLFARKKKVHGGDSLAKETHNQSPEKSRVSFHRSLPLLCAHPHDEAPRELHGQVLSVSLLLCVCPIAETCNFPAASTGLRR
jgi:hypothetical protein